MIVTGNLTKIKKYGQNSRKNTDVYSIDTCRTMLLTLVKKIGHIFVCMYIENGTKYENMSKDQ